MKNLMLIILISFLFISFATAQTQSTILETNNTSVEINNRGDLFGFGSSSHYFVPKDSTHLSTIYRAGIWLGGLDKDTQIHLAAMTYRQRGTDFWPGPSSKNGNVTAKKYDKMWTITKAEIEAHKTNPANPINSIATWPGNGDTTVGEPFQLAPFSDINGNGIYEPNLGDYPKIRGEVSTYCIYNDNNAVTPIGGQVLNVDVHQMFYQEKIGTLNGLADQTNLGWFKIVNRSNNIYTGFKMGVWIDYDLGNFADDKVATDTLYDYIYCYNGSNNDEGNNGYGISPPAEAMVFLNHQISSSTYYNNNANSINGNPSLAKDYYNYLNGNFRIFDYKSDLYSSKYWHPENPVFEDNQTQGDKRIVGTIGPFTLKPGESFCVDLAFIYARSLDGHLESVKKLKQLVRSTKVAYYNNLAGWKTLDCETLSTASSKPSRSLSEFTVYPNPSTGIFTIKGLKTAKPSVITNLAGQTLKTIEANTQTIDLSEFESGIYFLQTEVGSVRLIKI